MSIVYLDRFGIAKELEKNSDNMKSRAYIEFTEENGTPKAEIIFYDMKDKLLEVMIINTPFFKAMCGAIYTDYDFPKIKKVEEEGFVGSLFDLHKHLFNTSHNDISELGNIIKKDAAYLTNQLAERMKKIDLFAG